MTICKYTPFPKESHESGSTTEENLKTKDRSEPNRRVPDRRLFGEGKLQKSLTTFPIKVIAFSCVILPI